jgi:CheY-like chemotaxis protein
MKPTPEPPVLLLAEDDADDCLLIKDALEECQWSGQLRCVKDGEELLDYLLQRGAFEAGDAPRPGIILLDLNMPRKDGRQALQEIRANPTLRQIPVVVLTTSKADTDIAASYASGANSFIAKPIQFQGLVDLFRLLGQYWFQAVQLPQPK